jgi:hypothetical protein
MISLVLSVTSALVATLLQQWAREYVETPKSSIELKHRARVRSLLFRGAKLYQISLLVEILNINVAIAVDASAGLSGLAYVALTIPLCIDVKCPFRTPISKILIVVSVASFPLLRSVLPSIDCEATSWTAGST